jgi:hypothetical protein
MNVVTIQGGEIMKKDYIRYLLLEYQKQGYSINNPFHPKPVFWWDNINSFPKLSKEAVFLTEKHTSYTSNCIDLSVQEKYKEAFKKMYSYTPSIYTPNNIDSGYLDSLAKRNISSVSIAVIIIDLLNNTSDWSDVLKVNFNYLGIVLTSYVQEEYFDNLPENMKVFIKSNKAKLMKMINCYLHSDSIEEFYLRATDE